MDGLKNLIEVVYDFEPADEIEKCAVKYLIGGEHIYNAIRIFKLSGKTVEEAEEFFIKINDKFKIQDLLL